LVIVGTLAALCFAAPSSAGTGQTTCVSVLGAIDVGDVLVPPDALCVLEGTRVLGDVVVTPGAQLTASSASIEGNVDVTGYGYLFVDASTIGRDVVCAQAFCVLERTHVLGDAEAHLGSGTQLIATDTTIRGEVEVRERAAFGASGADIGRDVRCVDCDFVDVFHSTVAGTVRVSGNVYFGIGVFDSRVAGDVDLSRSAVGAPEEYRFFIEQNTIAGRLLVTRASGPLYVARNAVGRDLEFSRNQGFARVGETAIVVTANDVGGDLQFVANTGSSGISLNTIAGALLCRANDPPPVSVGNVFAEAVGQCAA
jgi:hypothetical protein